MLLESDLLTLAQMTWGGFLEGSFFFLLVLQSLQLQKIELDVFSCLLHFETKLSVP